MTRTDEPLPHAPSSVRPGRRRAALCGLAAGVAAAVLALAPWLITGALLPLQNLWRLSALPDEMPFSLLPVNQYYATVILALLVVGGAVAGLAVRILRNRMPVAAWSAAVGVLAIQGIVIIQSFTVVAGGLGIADDSAGARETMYFAGMLGGTLVSALLAQAAFWTVSARSVTVASLGLTLSAVPFTTWVVQLIDVVTGYAGPPALVSWLSHWLPAIIVGTVLGWCGIRPLRRLVVWVVGLAAIWITPALFTAVSSALGMRVLNGNLSEMADAAIRILPAALGESAPPVVLALVLAPLLPGRDTPSVRTRRHLWHLPPIENLPLDVLLAFCKHGPKGGDRHRRESRRRHL